MELKEEHEVIQRLARGETGKKIAHDMGKSQMAISRAKYKNKDLIQKEAERLISCLPDIMEQTIRDIQVSNEVSKKLAGEDITVNSKFNDKAFLSSFMALSYKKQSDIMRALGILTSNAPSIAINTLIHADKVEISPTVIKALGSYMQDTLKAVDVEITEVNGEETDD